MTTDLRVAVYLTLDEHRRFKALCAMAGESMNEVIRRLVLLQISQREAELLVEPHQRPTDGREEGQRD